MRLTQFVGLRPIETVPPTLEVTAPGNDKTVRPSFTVTANASDETGMDQVAALIDGTTMGSSSAPSGTTYTVALANVAEGAHTLEVQAIDLAGNITKKQLSINVALGKPGETCAIAADCHGNICAIDAEGTNFCTQACGDGNSCPDDFSCEPVGEQQVCVPDGGGCAVGGGNKSAFALILGAWIVLRRRGRARRS
jgi:hypothetical protein